MLQRRLDDLETEREIIKKERDSLSSEVKVLKEKTQQETPLIGEARNSHFIYGKCFRPTGLERTFH